MTWLGKVVGGAFGFFMGGPLGAILGAAFGHQFDRSLPNIGLLNSSFAPNDRDRARMAFFTAAFSVMGHVAKADGRVSEAEIATARTIMQRLELSDELRNTAMRLFGEGKQPHFPLDEALEQFRAECRRRYSLLRMFVELQMEIAYADGAPHEAQEQVLLRIVDRLRYSRFEFHVIKTRMDSERRFARAGSRFHQRSRWEQAPREISPTEAYALLGVSPTASESEIKRAYRKLMSRHHPDKLAANGLPAEKVQSATEKTQQIRSAYELIAKVRKF
jgi:DnaJ like chaperone protein